MVPGPSCTVLIPLPLPPRPSYTYSVAQMRFFSPLSTAVVYLVSFPGPPKGHGHMTHPCWALCAQ
jgi:hypothetical protein